MDASEQKYEQYLRVAWSYIVEIMDEGKIEELNNIHTKSDQLIESEGGHFRDILSLSSLEGSTQREILENLDMAWNSAEKAYKIGGYKPIAIDDLEISPATIFGATFYIRGQLEFNSEHWGQAINHYKKSVEYIPEYLEAWYNLGAAYINKHEPELAIEVFEKIVSLDPVGELGIEALKNIEKLKSGSLGRKTFTGSWGCLAVLAVFVLVSFFMIFSFSMPAEGFMNLLIWGGALGGYIWWKYK